MRFEAKHRYFKQLANNIGNFINIPHTLAMRHQMLQCYIQQDKYKKYLVPEYNKGMPQSFLYGITL